MSIPWYIYAMFAAVLWGVHYPLLGRAMTVISPITAYWIPTVIMVLGLPFFYKRLIIDFQDVWNATLDVKLSVIAITFTGFAASYTLYKAIQLHNAVHASLIEIAYPIFVALFAYLIFKENHLTWEVMVGGAFIMIGTILVIINS